MIFDRDITLLMSVSVQPNSSLTEDTIRDVQSRERDYLACFEYYLTHHPGFNKIVFFDNSGWPMDKFHKASLDNPLGKELEIVSVNCNEYPGEYGKGYGELLLIDKALSSSRLLASTPFFAKITGRNYLLNMSNIVAMSCGSYQMLCDLRDHRIYDILHINGCGHHCDTRFFVVAKDYYDRHFRRFYRQHREGTLSIEGSFYQIIKKLEYQNEIVCRFPVEPVYRGIAGHHRKNYGGIKERIKSEIRNWGRRNWPNLRI